MIVQSSRYDRFGAFWDPPLDSKLDSSNTVVFVFGDIAQRDLKEALGGLCRIFVKAAIVGCSTAGEVYGREVLLESLVVAVAKFEKTSVKQVAVPITSAAESELVGKALAEALNQEGLKGVILLAEGLEINGSRLTESLWKVLGPEIPIAGGLAGDYERFERTYVLDDCLPVRKHVTAIGFYGDTFCMTTACRGGWSMHGEPMRITKAKGNVLMELDGRPALDIYKNLMDDKDAAALPSRGLLYPLAVKSTRGGMDEKVRTVLAVSDLTRTITFAGEIPEGGWATLMRTDEVDLEAAAQDTATIMVEDYMCRGPVLCLVVSCVGRRLLLGGNTSRELAAVYDGLPKEHTMVGFYSYGEISTGYDGRCDLHNQTMTLALIGEDGYG